MNANDISTLLATRHSDDVFVPECNMGSAWARCRRMDAWAMKKSWANPMTWGYEIKVSRSDFMNDDKWHEYLSFCNEFYWVCPWGLIQPNEVGEGAGLMWVTKTGSRIVRKVKAVRREIEFPEQVFRYVLMSRARIVGDMHESNRPGMREVWENWLQERKIDKQFGWMVGKAIREQVETEILAVQQENQRLQQKFDRYETIRETIKELGLDPDQPPSKWAARAEIDKMRAVIPSGLKVDIERCQSQLQRMKDEIEAFEEPPQ